MGGEAGAAGKAVGISQSDLIVKGGKNLLYGPPNHTSKAAAGATTTLQLVSCSPPSASTSPSSFKVSE